MKNSSRLIVLSSVAFMILGVGLALGIVPYQLDDAYITYRYAENVANGNGLTFNPGQEPVEGFSSPIWLLLLSTGALIFGSLSLPTLSLFLGLTGYILCFLVILVKGGKRENKKESQEHPEYSWLIPIGLLSVLPTATFYAASGLESLLFLAALLVFSRSVNGSLPVKWGLFAGFLAPWIRPEGSWFLAAMICQLMGKGEGKKIFQKKNILLGGSVVLGNLTLVMTRLIIFGQIFPNTYFAKTPWLKASLLYIGHTLSSNWGITLFVVSLLGAILGSRKHRGYFFAGLCWIFAVLLEGGDWMPAGRLLLPAFGMFMLAVPGIIENRFLKTEHHKFTFQRWYTIFAIMLTVFVMVLNLKASLNLKKQAHLTLSNATFLEQVLSDWISKSQANSLATTDIGMMGFFTKIEIVDLAGLTDRVIGRSSGYHLQKDFNLSYIFNERKPDIIVLRVVKPPAIYSSGRIVSQVKSAVENRVMQDNRFQKDYHFLFAILPPHPTSPYTGKLIFGQKDFQIAPEAIPPKPVLYISPQQGYE